MVAGVLAGPSGTGCQHAYSCSGSSTTVGGCSDLHRSVAAWQRGVPEPRWYERNDERTVQALFDVRVLGLPTPSVEETE